MKVDGTRMRTFKKGRETNENDKTKIEMNDDKKRKGAMKMRKNKKIRGERTRGKKKKRNEERHE